MNLDYVYQVPHFVAAGETLSSTGYDVRVGGKGLNQSVALAKAGADVVHAGATGIGAKPLIEFLQAQGISTDHLRQSNFSTGHTVIQVTPSGENCILLYQGANADLNLPYIDKILALAKPGDYLLTQNETNLVPEIIKRGHAQGLIVALNPSPVTEELAGELPYECVDFLLLNEIEAEALTGSKVPDIAAKTLAERSRNMRVVLTLGKSGAICQYQGKQYRQEAYSVQAVDTTAAGDTFTGYFLSAIMSGKDEIAAMELAARASALTVSRPGAAESIPTLEDVFNLQF